METIRGDTRDAAQVIASAPRRGAAGLLWGILLAALSGCVSGPDRLSEVAASFSSDGALHLAARLRSASREGGGWAHIAFLYARKDPNGALTRLSPNVSGQGGDFCDDLRQLLVEGATGQYLFLETGFELSFWLDQGSGMSWIGIAPGVPDDARQTSGQRLHAAWRDEQAVRLLTDRWLYRIEGAQIVDALAISGTCDAATRLCYVAPGSASAGTDVQAEAVTLGSESPVISQLTCAPSGGECAWTATDVALGTGDLGGTSCRRGRFFFRVSDRDGTPTTVFVRTTQAESGANYRVLANRPGGELELVADNGYFLGASALPAGGYAVAVEDYDEQLRLVLVEADLATRRVVDLGRRPNGFMNNALTVLASGESVADQRAHLIFGVGTATVQHLTIRAADGTIEGDELLELRQ